MLTKEILLEKSKLELIGLCLSEQALKHHEEAEIDKQKHIEEAQLLEIKRLQEEIEQLKLTCINTQKDVDRERSQREAHLDNTRDLKDALKMIEKMVGLIVKDKV